MKVTRTIALLSLLLIGAMNLNASTHEPESFKAGDGVFLLNGEPFVIKAAELHYPRIPREYWDHRIKMCKALGMNTICLYVFWNVHEEEHDQFDFAGQKDLSAFIDLCAENDMKVILRPGPYVCAEWEMGGLPWWLLKKEDIHLRQSDPYFIDRVNKFQKAVADEVRDHTIANGGPIIMIQVENEYGSYGEDKEYIATIRDMLRDNFGNDVTLFQCDWSSNFLKNGLDDLIWTLNFGTGADIDRQFAPLKEHRPDSPLMCSEYWSGWFDKWGANHETRPADAMIAGIKDMLDKGISFSLYMTHGGTNWGHWAGANSPGYAPDVTSYDYDAPINEQGAATPKYHVLRKLLAGYSDEKLPPVPKAIPTMEIAPFELTQVAPLFSNLPEAKFEKETMTMEELGQGFGSTLYRTTLPKTSSSSLLTVTEPHDYAQIFIDGKYLGKLDRRLGERALMIPAVDEGAVLDILVEAMGRINFGRAIKDYKGITQSVTLTEQRGNHTFVCNLENWDIYNLPDSTEFYSTMKFEPIECALQDTLRLPVGVYRGRFSVDKIADTFLDLSTWGKGLVYVNGHALGRFWHIGPQQTLYLPGCWLKKGENEIVIFDIIGPKQSRISGFDVPIIDKLNLELAQKHRNPGQKLDLTGDSPIAEGAFKPGSGWQEIQFERPIKGRFLCLEMLNSISGNDDASIAELYLLDSDNLRLSREQWTIRYADSEKDKPGNHTADKIFDLQESTYWSTEPGSKYPHAIVIDLGAEKEINGLQYLPRMETDVPGAIKEYRLYIKQLDFTNSN